MYVLDRRCHEMLYIIKGNLWQDVGVQRYQIPEIRKGIPLPPTQSCLLWRLRAYKHERWLLKGTKTVDGYRKNVLRLPKPLGMLTDGASMHTTFFGDLSSE